MLDEDLDVGHDPDASGTFYPECEDSLGQPIPGCERDGSVDMETNFGLEPWELETTARQFAILARLHDPDARSSEDFAASEAWGVLRDVYGDSYRISPEMTVTSSIHEPLRLRYFKKLNEFLRRKDYDQQLIKSDRQKIAIETLKNWKW